MGAQGVRASEAGIALDERRFLPNGVRGTAVLPAHDAVTVDLTSRPSREAANRLYQRIGFVARDTNVYRFAQPDQVDS